jgi:hypothetical protein
VFCRQSPLGSGDQNRQGEKLLALALILMIKPPPRQGLLKFGGSFYQEKCRIAGFTRKGAKYGNFNQKTGIMAH